MLFLTIILIVMKKFNLKMSGTIIIYLTLKFRKVFLTALVNIKLDMFQIHMYVIIYTYPCI